MSSSSAGKFQDHYIVLGVETNADSATIHAAYSKLAQKFHPDNPETGDQQKFESLNQAYEVLCDPELRISFDKVKGVDHEAGNPKFTGADFFRALAMGAELRAAVLCILYDRRRVKSFKPSLPMRLLEGMLNIQGEGLNFALWYLKKRGFVVYDDKSAMEITVEGMDFLEQNRPSAEAVMMFIKKEALMPQPELPMEPKIAEPLLSVLGRALQRNHPGGK
jgi:curved DNA-binding protein CbpA